MAPQSPRVIDIAGPAPAADPAVSNLSFDTGSSPDPGGVPISVTRPMGPPAPSAPPAPLDPPMPPSPMAPPIDDHMSPHPHELFHSDSDHTPPPPAPVDTAPKSPKKGGKMWLWILILVVLVLIGGYAAADDGLVPGGSHLPYHVFSHYKSSSSTTTTTTTTTTSSVPTGFSQYQLSDASIQFDAPTSWGTPSFASDPGYSSRSTGAKSDGTHAYLVTFAKNKDVQLSLTSGALLPASASDNRYFDALQWCQGSIDQKFYLQRLLYTTANKVDTPANVACDEGPIPATQLDATTIEIAKAKSTAGGVLGDMYVKNLSGNQNAVVMRALDATMSNGDDIKTLLGTVQNL